MNEWIACDEEMPELIWNEFLHEYRRGCIVADRNGLVFAADFVGEDKRLSGNCWELDCKPCGNVITHWQPMPTHPHPEWLDEHIAGLDRSWRCRHPLAAPSPTSETGE